MRATILIIDSEIETLPRDKSKGAKFRATSDAVFGQGEVILDSWLHADILKYMSGGTRRGRPDIVHHALSLCVSSLAYRRGYVDVIVHTRNDDVIKFGRNAYVPQNYFEFLHMLGALYLNGHVGTGDSAITIESVSGLDQLLQSVGSELNVVMSPHGEVKGLENLLRGFGSKTASIMFGGFPEGEYRSPAYDLADITVTLGTEWLNINAVTAEILRCLPK
jgi:rRNA small subunit pseudouridine methyltransferase Nep1